MIDDRHLCCPGNYIWCIEDEPLIKRVPKKEESKQSVGGSDGA